VAEIAQLEADLRASSVWCRCRRLAALKAEIAAADDVARLVTKEDV
jgi:hypothetical protein